MYTLEGVGSVRCFIAAYGESQWSRDGESQWSRDSRFLICNVYFVSKDNLWDIY